MRCSFTGDNTPRAGTRCSSSHIRIATIQVDPAQVTACYAALREQMQAAVKQERGVLTYYAVADKKGPA